MNMGAVDSDWEFHAPQYFDFMNPDTEQNDEADAWFDVQEEAEIEDESGFCDESQQGQENELSRNEKEQRTVESVSSTEPGATKFRRGEKRQRTTESASSVTNESPSVKRSRTTPQTRSGSAQAVRRTAPSSKRRVPPPMIRKPLRPNNRSAKPPSVPTVKVPTIPVTPSCMRRKQAKSTAVKSTEEIELEKIEESRKLAEQQLLKAKKSYQQLNSGKGVVSATLTKSATTVPAEFHFHTDSRIKSHGMETRMDIRSQDFRSILRKPDTPTGSFQTRGLTVTKPFSLHESKVTEKGYKFTSDAQKIIAFQKNTPDRFRTRARNKARTPLRQSPRLNKLTVAKTPNLETKCRKRNIHVVSQAEWDEKEAEEVRRYKFQAKPVNQKLLNQADSLPEVPVRDTTKPCPFNLHPDTQHSVTHTSVSEEKHEFHARPVPIKILGGVVGVKPAKEIPCTVPESPAFALKNRLRSIMDRTNIQLEEPAQKLVKANPVPHYGTTFQPKLNHKQTVPQPFSFENRDKDKVHAKEEKIKHVLEEEKKMHEFHANPLPSSSPDDLPQKKVKPVTNPEPFNLECNTRGTYKSEEWAKRMDDDLKNLRNKASSFKARPNRVTNTKPFEPKKSEKLVTDVCEMELNTDRRAAERREFERRKRLKKEELEAVLDEVRKRKEAEEQEELARLRAETVHKSKPIRHYKPVVVRSSEKELTQPLSPRFSDRLAFK